MLASFCDHFECLSWVVLLHIVYWFVMTLCIDVGSILTLFWHTLASVSHHSSQLFRPLFRKGYFWRCLFHFGKCVAPFPFWHPFSLASFGFPLVPFGFLFPPFRSSPWNCNAFSYHVLRFLLRHVQAQSARLGTSARSANRAICAYIQIYIYMYT